MASRNYLQTLGAGQVIRLPAGRFFMVRTASAPLDITAEGRPGAPVDFIGITAGSRFGPLPEGMGWRHLRVTSASAQNVEIIISDDGDFDVANTVSVAGAVATTDVPSSSIVATANTTVGVSSSLDIAANLSRRRITICNDLNSQTHVWVRDQTGTASGGIQLAPGMAVTLETTAAIRIRNNDAALVASVATLEES
jgi:hypothetical protein